MNRFLAIVRPVGAGGLVLIEPVSAIDPGFGARPPVDPDYGFGTFPHPGHGLPGFGHPDQGLPGYGHPDQGLPGYGHPSHPLPVPPPEGVVSPPITLPERPHLPAGSGIVVPFPAGVARPEPKGDEPTPAPDAEPYILWFGPGTKSSVIWVVPAIHAGPK